MCVCERENVCVWVCVCVRVCVCVCGYVWVGEWVFVSVWLGMWLGVSMYVFGSLCVCVCECFWLGIVDQMELPYHLNVTNCSMPHRPGMLHLFFWDIPEHSSSPCLLIFIGPFFIVPYRTNFRRTKLSADKIFRRTKFSAPSWNFGSFVRQKFFILFMF